MSETTAIGILGADGRMGQAILQALHGRADAQLVAALSAPDAPDLGRDIGQIAGLGDLGVPLTSDIAAGLALCDVLIDFSAPRATLAVIDIMCMGHVRCKVLVTGTTGYTSEEEDTLRAAGKAITLLRSGNFSLGVNMLEALVEQATRALQQGWDIEVLEMHHRHKVDAPSGTALMLGEAAARGRDVALEDVQVLSREGRGAARADGQIGFAALRGGGVIGAHEVRLASELEMITLSHDAFDRSVFAQGAVQAAFWAVDKPAGLYDMKDVLGL